MQIKIVNYDLKSASRRRSKSPNGKRKKFPSGNRSKSPSGWRSKSVRNKELKFFLVWRAGRVNFKKNQKNNGKLKKDRFEKSIIYFKHHKIVMPLTETPELQLGFKKSFNFTPSLIPSQIDSELIRSILLFGTSSESFREATRRISSFDLLSP